MGLCEEDSILIKILYEFRGYVVKRIFDKTIEEDYCERFFETFETAVYDSSEVR